MAARQRTPVAGKPRSDVYTGLLIISLIAQIVGIVFFYLDWSAYPSTKAPTVQMPNLSSPAASGTVQPPAGSGQPPAGGGAAPVGGAGQPPAGNPGPPPAGGVTPAVGGQPK